jgi:penicillin-binding protein 1A
MKSMDKSDEEIIAHSAKSKMTVLLEGRKIYYDSYRFYSTQNLQSGLMAMEPQTGNIKAWVDQL